MKKVPLYGKDGIGRFAVVDDEDYDKVKGFHWIIGNTGRPYAVLWRKKINNKWKQKNVSMHRYIFQVPNDKQVDHINCNVLDNRKKNLRIATHQQNQFNRPARGASGRKGVTWHKGANKWMAQIEKNGKPYYLGLFTDIEMAAQAYNQTAIELFGEFAHVS